MFIKHLVNFIIIIIFFFIVIHGKTSVYWKTSSCKYLKIPHKLKNVEGWKGQMLTSKCKFTLYRFSSSLILNLSNVASHNYSGVPNPAHSRTRKNHSVRTSHKRIFAFHAPRAIISSAILTRSLPTAKSIKKKGKVCASGCRSAVNGFASSRSQAGARRSGAARPRREKPWKKHFFFGA